MTWKVGVPNPYQTNKFCVYRSYAKGDETFIICHVVSCDPVIKTHMTLQVGTSHPKSRLCQV